jgi:hypothetical protein
MQKDVDIGIFRGRSATYNIAILETLTKEGELTSWQLAKKIREANYPNLEPDTAKIRTQRIYSALIRRNGRLDDLKEKEYIALEGKKWTPQFKALAILILKPELAHQIHPDFKPTKSMKIQSNLKAKLPFGIKVKIDKKQLQTWVNKFSKKLLQPETYKTMAKWIEELVETGIDLDRIKDNDFAFLLIERMRNYFEEG